MRLKLVTAVVVALIVSLFVVPVALAVSQSTIDAILKDAADGTLNGNWSKAQVAAAIAYVNSHPAAKQYTDVGALEEFVAGSQAPGATAGGNLAFTGANLLLAFVVGGGLLTAGLALRRRLT